MISESNPYVGPQPFRIEDKDLFFGRDIETNKLSSLIIAHRALLFYAQSGAGKTSLINASIIPKFETEGFIILPVARVGLPLDDDKTYNQISNIYAYNAISSWKIEGSSSSFFNTTLAQALGKFDEPRMIIFDQFEEIFTTYDDRWKERELFFKQLGESLENDHFLRAVIIMREDFIARIEPFVNCLPERLRVRFRIERLREKQALEAVKNPLAKFNRSFAEGTAENLVQELLKIKNEDSNGNISEFIGEYVDPLQLQLTCLSLWRKLPSNTFIITDNDIEEFTNVDEILSEFYENTITSVATRQLIDARRIRLFFEEVLITKLGTRGTIYRGKNETAGIPNRVINEIEESHLIYAEIRSGARWYELTHDRFINPILQSNKRFFAKTSLAWKKWYENLLEIQSNGIATTGEQLTQISSSEIENYGHLQTLIDYGQLLLNTRRYNEAISFFTKILEQSKENILANYYRGAAYWYLGELQQAANDFTSILELTEYSNPGYIHYLCFHNRGQVYAEMNRNKEAINDLEKAIQIEEILGMDPGFARNGLALALGNVGQFERSLQEFETTLLEHPYNSWAYYNRALIYEKMSLLQLALKDYKTALHFDNQGHLPLTDSKRKYAKSRVEQIEKAEK